MSVAEQVGAHLPGLRRYARALTGSQSLGDRIVRTTLETALADKDLLASILRGKVELYRAFTQIWSNARVRQSAGPGDGLHEAAAQARLAAITPDHRQALLLVLVEGFSFAEAGAIIGCAPEEVEAMVVRAVAQIDKALSTDVLIIEDEPIISIQLEDLVLELGHNVIGCATTRGEAATLVAEHRPGLVLADIQLADGSSGIAAVEDILRSGDVPVIFITAFPEKLLASKRLRPAYVISKPFQKKTVRAAISQALFFGSSRPLTR